MSDTEAAAPEMVGKLSFQRTPSGATCTNRQKCLVLGSRSMTSKVRHLLGDMAALMPHARPHSKVETRHEVGEQLEQLCGLHRCNSFAFVEARKHETSFLWLGQAPAGPSMKFELLNVHTADELRMSGNCLKYSRPLLHFDKEFDTMPHLKVAKSLLVQTYNAPRYHAKAKPFHDHIVSVFFLDGKLWFRHYQLLPDQKPDMGLTEIGPRFTLDPILILNGCCHGSVLWKSQSAMAPGERRMARRERVLTKMRENERLKGQAKAHRNRNPAPAAGPLSAVFADPEPEE